MVNFLRTRKLREEQFQYLESLKNTISKEKIKIPSLRKKTTVTINKKIDDIYSHLNKVNKKLEAIQKKSVSEDAGIKDETAKKSRVKEKIKSMLKHHRKLTSSQLSELIGLSRTRCNEYFKEMSKQGVVESVIIGRKKFYKLQR